MTYSTALTVLSWSGAVQGCGWGLFGDQEVASVTGPWSATRTRQRMKCVPVHVQRGPLRVQRRPVRSVTAATPSGAWKEPGPSGRHDRAVTACSFGFGRCREGGPWAGTTFRPPAAGRGRRCRRSRPPWRRRGWWRRPRTGGGGLGRPWAGPGRTDGRSPVLALLLVEGEAGDPRDLGQECADRLDEFVVAGLPRGVVQGEAVGGVAVGVGDQEPHRKRPRRVAVEGAGLELFQDPHAGAAGLRRAVAVDAAEGLYPGCGEGAADAVHLAAVALLADGLE